MSSSELVVGRLIQFFGVVVVFVGVAIGWLCCDRRGGLGVRDWSHQFIAEIDMPVDSSGGRAVTSRLMFPGFARQR